MQVDILSLFPIFQEEDDNNSNALSVVEAGLGRHLSPAELDFVEAVPVFLGGQICVSATSCL